MLDFLRLFHPIQQADYELIQQHLTPKTYAKGEFIVMEGQVQRSLLFVEKGVQMSYFEGKKKQHVVAFTYAPGICAVPDSFMGQIPSRHFLQCLSDSQFQALSYEALQQLFDLSQPIERLFRRMTEAVLIGLITRLVEAQALSIEERFRAFARRSPHLLQLVPHKHIASYLGIDASNFSKLYNSVRI